MQLKIEPNDTISSGVNEDRHSKFDKQIEHVEL